MANYVRGEGPGEAQLMFMGEAPGQSEDFTGRPFVGPTGQLLDEICREVGLDRRAVYISNVVKYRPPNNMLKRLGEVLDHEGQPVTIDSQISQMWDEVNAIKPNCIVAFGNLPLKALTGKGNGFKGIMKWRGSCIKSQHFDYKVVPTIHPAALLHAGGELEDDRPEYGKKKGPLKYSYRHILKLDLLRAIRQSESSIYAPPERVIEIARDSVQLARFLDLYADRNKYPYCSVDIEVTRSVPYCIGLAFNNWHAISVPLMDIFSWQNHAGIQDHQLAEMWLQIARLLDSDVKVIGQNFKFDQGQLWNLCRIKIRNFHADTGLMAHCLHPEFPKALEFLTSIYTEEPYYKDEGREFDWKKDKVERVLNYNGRDAVVTFEVFEQLLKDAKDTVVPGFPNWCDDFVLDYVGKLHNFYRDLEAVGFRVDNEKQKILQALYTKKIEVAQLELDTLAGWKKDDGTYKSVNVNSKTQLAVLVYNQLKYPIRKGTSEEVIVSLLANTKKQTPQGMRILELILLLRRLKLSLKKYFQAQPDYDGRMKTIYTIAGTETGRSNTKVLKPPVRPETLGIPFQTMTKHGDIGTEIREMFLADEGYVLVETDMSQAEARIVALFANDYKLLQLFKDKADIHKITASMIFGVPVNDITAELRFIGKTTRHAGNYDMGKHRLMELVNTEAKRQHIDVRLSEYKANIILTKFHAFSPNIRGVFHKAIQDALEENNRTLVNPFGRQRQFFDRWSRELFKEAYAQLPQSTVPDHLRLAGMRAQARFKAEGIDARFVVEAHDALIGLVKAEHKEAYVKIMHEEIEVPIDFSRCTIKRGELIIPAESKWGYNYKEFNKKTGDNPQGLRGFEIVKAA